MEITSMRSCIISDTPLSVGEVPTDYDQVTGVLNHGSASVCW